MVWKKAVCIAVLLAAFASVARAAPVVDVSGVGAAVTEKNPQATVPANVRISGEWALCDESDGAVKTAEAVLHFLNGKWVVVAELAGAGVATPEALTYHDVPEGVVNRLLPGAVRGEMKPVLALLRQMMPGEYPVGYLMENVAIVENYALCSYRFRESVRKSDVFGQALVRKTGGKWHLIEKGNHPIDLAQYGISSRIQRALRGQL